jgi:peroxiredoxin
MKKLAFWIMTLIMPLVLLAQEENNYSITGEVKDDGVKEVYLTYFGGHGIDTDSARVVDHIYRLTGKVATGMAASLSSAGPDEIPTPDRLVTLFLLPSESFRIVHGKSFSAAVISGSPANTAFDKLIQLSKAYDARKAGQPGEGEREEVYGRYILENPNSPLLYYAFRQYAGDLRWVSSGDVPKVRSLMAMLPDSIRSSATMTLLSQQLDNKVTFDKAVGIGQPAPDFTQNDTAGRPVSLSSFRGKYVLLDFWASWCGPCRQESPAVVAAYQNYHTKGFEIVGVSLDQNEKSWKKAIRDDKLTWTHVSDLKYWSNALVKLYGVEGVPQNFLIDPQGNIIARGLRGAELDKKLSEIYKN